MPRQCGLTAVFSISNGRDRFRPFSSWAYVQLDTAIDQCELVHGRSPSLLEF